MLTGDRSGNAKTRALSAGATDFLTKPFDSTEVVLRVANLLETRRLHQDLRAQNLRLEERVQERPRTCDCRSPPTPGAARGLQALSLLATIRTLLDPTFRPR